MRPDDPGGLVLSRLASSIADALSRSHHRRRSRLGLLADGLGKISRKVGEELLKVVVAVHTEDDERLASEAADLLYHLLVLLQIRGVPLDSVWQELEKRKR